MMLHTLAELLALMLFLAAIAVVSAFGCGA